MSYSPEMQRILDLIPVSGEDVFDFDTFYSTELALMLDSMKHTRQDPEYHGEGDVYCHTRAVCESLVGLDDYKVMEADDKRTVFLAALLHDIGKIRCTRERDGRIVSPYHTKVGAVMARELLWHRLGLCGSREAQQLREAVCQLIRYHSFPPYASSDENGEVKLLKIASNGELASGFSMHKLCLLEKADVLGRISSNADDYMERILCCEIMAEELSCTHNPYVFADAHSQREYFRRGSGWRDGVMYDDTWGEVILMCGLPGTGKDTWIENNHPDMPVVSLDAVRQELNVSPKDNQSKVVATAREYAREHLRRKRPFIWNATSVTGQLRSNFIDLAESYGAKVRLVFLETSYDEELRRNADRQARVPREVIDRMLSNFETPERFECDSVEWRTL